MSKSEIKYIFGAEYEISMTVGQGRKTESGINKKKTPVNNPYNGFLDVLSNSQIKIIRLVDLDCQNARTFH